MAQTNDASLEQRLLDLESSVRALRTTDPFGLVTASNPAQVEMWGVANAGPGGVGWIGGGPTLSLYVASGRLRVDVAAALDTAGNKAEVFMSWAVLGPADSAAASLTAAQAIGPAYDRSIEIQYNGTGMDQRSAQATFDTHPGLAPGWYTVTARYALSYSGSTTQPYGLVTNRRVAAMPY